MSSGRNLSLPFSFAPDQSWNGNAGSWSTFIIRIGTPPQDFSILPSTSGHQPWVPVPLGCTPSDPPNCASLRGAQPFQGAISNGFQSNQSTTWKEKGFFSLAIETDLGLSGNGDFGYDTVGLEVENSGGLTLVGQVVGGIATPDFWVGQLGLGPKPSNFSTFESPVPNYLKTLATTNSIPSFSYGYTAGAKYRLDKVLGSLTLGGYDASRFVASNISIPFASDDSRLLTVGVQSIRATGTLQGDVEPMSRGNFFLIDSSVPDLWLPLAACQIFEDAFGLIYDNNTNLYLVNDTIHSKLVQLDPTITLTIGNQTFDGPTMDITLPYGAFDLQASSPIYPNTTNYFPIRRGDNSSQYTLGRTFLQEAYIIVNYEQSNFSVNQAVFRSPNPEDIVTIHPKNYTAPDNRHHQHLSPGEVAGAVVGPVVFLLICLTIIILLLRRRRNTKRQRFQETTTSTPPELEVLKSNNDGQLEPSMIWIPELDPKAEVIRTPQELSTNLSVQDSRSRHGPGNSTAVSELPSPGVP